MAHTNIFGERRGTWRVVDLLAFVPRLNGTLVLAAGVVVLLGWSLDIRLMQSFLPGFVTMKPNAALGLCASALALLLHAHGATSAAWAAITGRALAACVVTLGTATLAQYVYGVDLRIDQLLLRVGPEEAAQSATPGRMAAVSALAFILIGGALLGLGTRRIVPRWTAQWLALGAGALALASLFGHLYGAIATVGPGHGVQIAVHTAIAIVLLAGGVLCADDTVGWMPMLRSHHAGGVLARRLLPIAVIVPFTLGTLRHIGAWLGVGNVEADAASVAILTMLTFGALIWRTAVALDRSEAQWRAAEQARDTAEREHLELILRAEAARERAKAERSARHVAEEAHAAAERARNEAERAGVAAREALALFDLVLDSTPAALALFDRQLRCWRVNVAFAALHGLTPEALTGRRASEVALERGDEFEAALRMVLETGQGVADAQGTTNAGGLRHWVSSVFPVRSATGDVIGVGLTLTDITERKRLQAQLRQAQKMEAVGQIAGGVAHDFNNILTVVNSYADFLRRGLPSDSALQADVEEIRAAARRASTLTRQLLAFSRQQVLAPRLLDLNDVVRGMHGMLARVIGADVQLSHRLAAELPPCFADPGQLELVLMNLAVNARDAMPDGGQLTIETAVVVHETAGREGTDGGTTATHVLLAVSDTGVGMDEHTRARIFEPFFTTKEQGKGTGLGLATVYGIVQQSGGTITVHSVPGVGTTFKVLLPVCARVDAAPRPAAAPEAGTTARATGGVILVVDDEPALRGVARRALEEHGHCVLEAANGVEALALVHRTDRAIDVLVTDVTMPELGGVELVEQMAVVRPHTRALLMSGFTSGALLRRGVLPDGVAFLDKPFTPEVLVSRIAGMLGPRAAGRRTPARAVVRV